MSFQSFASGEDYFVVEFQSYFEQTLVKLVLRLLKFLGFFFFLVFFYVDYSHVRSVQPFLEFYQKYCRLFSFESLKLTDQEETFCFYLILSGVSFNSRRPLNASFCSTVALHICAEQRHLDQKPFSKHRRF